VFALAGFECFCAMRFKHYKRGRRIVTETPEGALYGVEILKEIH